uniref:Uncharacterized protein n=1 Tax=Oryza sativa subsp. japonica TaxID=39947 RepID=Q6F2W3_ORYSJ|nr:hypothetical protein [Oryza sativa Japonica Group]
MAWVPKGSVQVHNEKDVKREVEAKEEKGVQRHAPNQWFVSNRQVLSPPHYSYSSLMPPIPMSWNQFSGIGLICTGKINNPRRGVSIAKAQHNVSYGCSRIVNVFPQIVVISTHRKIGPTTALSDEWNSGFINLYIMEGCYRIVLHIDY